MNCPKCCRVIPDDAVLCCYCGKKILVDKVKHRRTKGDGTVYKRGNTWTVRISTPTTVDNDGNSHRHRPSKGGFKTKADASAYAQTLRKGPVSSPDITLDKLYVSWEKSYEKRVGASTMNGYRAGYNYYKKLHYRQVSTIRPADLQAQIDACPKGKRTKQNMKVVAGLLWKYALDNGIANRNIAENLYTGNDPTESWDPFTMQELKLLKESVGKEEYADYVVAMCYTGFRPGELLAIKTESLRKAPKDNPDDPDRFYLIGGGKTEAGTNRIVTIPPTISQIISNRAKAKCEYLFPDLETGMFMNHEHFRECCFNPLMERLGISGRVPYSCRHTYSNLLKEAPGDSGDKARLMGHTDYTFTQERYQSSDFDSLFRITDSLT